MNKTLAIIALSTVVAGGAGYYGYKTFYQNEKEKVVEAINNTLNLKTSTTQSIITVTADGLGLEKEQKELLEKSKIAMQMTKTGVEKQEAYMIVQTEVEGYKLSTNIGIQTDLKEEKIKLDISGIFETMYKMAEDESEKVDAVLKKLNETDVFAGVANREELKTELERMEKEIGKRSGLSDFKLNEPFIYTVDIKKLVEDGVMSEEEYKEIKNNAKEDGRIDIEKLINNGIMKYIGMLDKEIFQNSSINLNLNQAIDIAAKVLVEPQIKADVMKEYEKRTGEKMTDEEYIESVSQMPKEWKEIKDKNQIEANMSFQYKIDKENKILEQANLVLNLGVADARIGVVMKNKITPTANYKMKGQEISHTETMSAFQEINQEVGGVSLKGNEQGGINISGSKDLELDVTNIENQLNTDELGDAIVEKEEGGAEETEVSTNDLLQQAFEESEKDEVSKIVKEHFKEYEVFLKENDEPIDIETVFNELYSDYQFNTEENLTPEGITYKNYTNKFRIEEKQRTEDIAIQTVKKDDEEEVINFHVVLEKDTGETIEIKWRKYWKDGGQKEEKKVEKI